jgi:hypothetical protein
MALFSKLLYAYRTSYVCYGAAVVTLFEQFDLRPSWAEVMAFGATAGLATM